MSAAAPPPHPHGHPRDAGGGDGGGGGGGGRGGAADHRGPVFKIGAYVLGRTIGKGSFGKVKMAEHEQTGHTVAVKILNRQKIKTSQMDKKIRREIKILKLFRHPHIIRLYEVIETSTEILMCMEYSSKGELFDYIVQSGKLQENAARRFFQQIVGGVEYCHYYKVVHRDLKPENLLLDGDTNVKIVDFGLSNLMRDGDFLKTSCGSPNYAAPEVISGKLYAGPEVDVWSCGVILYALLCGRLPFDEENIPQLFRKIKEGRYTTPSSVGQGPRDLIARILIVDPLTRYTIPAIREHQWFREHLPEYLDFAPGDLITADQQEPDPLVVAQVVKKLKSDGEATAAEVVAAVASPDSSDRSRELAVAYNILLDTKRRDELTKKACPDAASGGFPAPQRSGTGPAAGGGGGWAPPLSSSVPASAFFPSISSAGLSSRAGDLPPALSSSPVMESILQSGPPHGGGGALRRRYNQASFVMPSSLQAGSRSFLSSSPPFSTSYMRHADPTARSAPVQRSGAQYLQQLGSPQPGGLGAAAGARPPHPPQRPDGAESSPGTRAAAIAAAMSAPFPIHPGNSPPGLTPTPGAWAGQLAAGAPPRMGMESPQPGLMRQQPGGVFEQRSLSQGGGGLGDPAFGWRLGLMTDSKSEAVMGEIYSVAEQRGLVWKVVGQFHVCLKRQDHVSGQGVRLSVRLYRMHDQHNRGYLIDLARLDGPVLPCLDLAAELYDALRSKLG